MPVEIVRVRPSEGWATHKRRKKAAERKALPPKAESTKLPKPEDPAVRHWKNIVSAIGATFHQDQQMLELFNKNNKFFRRFASGRRNVTLGLNTSDYQEMVEVYFTEDSPRYNKRYSEVISTGGPILQLITSETSRLGHMNGKR